MTTAVLSLLIVMLFAFALYALADIRPATAPLVSVVTLVNVTVVMALFNMLQTGVITAYLLAVSTFAFAVYKNKDNLMPKLSGFLSPGVVLFLISSIAMLVFMAYTQPVFHEWDEFSFWGISQLLIKKHNQLYTYFSSSMLGQSIPPALPVLSYFFQWANPVFAEWIGFFAYDVLFFAAFAAFTGAFEKKSWNGAIFVYILSFLTPFFFALSSFIAHMKSVYISVYSDIPLALTFGGAVAVYFFSEKDDSRAILPVLSLLMFLTSSKDMGLALSCIALFIIFFDLLVSRKQFTFLKVKGFIGKCLAAVAMLAVTGGTFFGWSFHLGRVLELNRTDFDGSSSMGMVEMLLTGIKEFLIGPKSEKFLTIQGNFFSAFFNTKVSMIGSGRNIVLFIVIIFVLAFVLGDKKGKKRSVMMLITGSIGFAGYYIFHILLYVYVLGDEAYNMVSYDRYMYAYYIPWLMFAVFNLTMAIKNGKRFWAKGSLIGITGCMLLLFHFYTVPENIFTGINGNSYTERRDVAVKADYIRDAIGEDDVIFVYSGIDDGMRWFVYTYELIDNYIIPNRSIYEYGATEEETKRQSQQALYDRFIDYGVTHVLIDHVSPDFMIYFDELFEDDTGHIGNVRVGYYRVNYTDNWFNFELVKGGQVTYD